MADGIDEPYDPGNPLGSVFNAPFGSRLLLAVVEGYDFLLDDAGNEVQDNVGNSIPTGLLNIRFADKGGERSKVPFLLPTAGNSAFIGSLPEIGAFCVVGFRQQEVAIILGFIPPTIHGLIKSRRTIPNLAPGEVFMQSSTRDVDATVRQDFFRGASVHLDRYGRIKLETEGYEMVMGYLLSNEFTAEVSRQLDPITGQAIFFRERIVDSVERRVDEQGNAIYSVLKDDFTEVGGNKTTTVDGTETRIIKGGFTYKDDAGNEITLKPDGGVSIVAGSGSLNFTSLGNMTEQFIANQQTIVGVSRSNVITIDDLLKIGGIRTVQVAGLIPNAVGLPVPAIPGQAVDVYSVLAGDMERHIFNGDWITRLRTGNATLEALIGRVLLGRGTASEAAMLGNAWVGFMTALLFALSTHVHPTAVGPSGPQI